MTKSPLLRRAILLLGALAAVSCSSGPQRGGGGGRSGGARSGEAMMPRVIAEPAGLFYAGMDTNGDGETSRAEAEALLPAIFKAADTDGSGTIRPTEFQGFQLLFLGSRDTALAVSSYDRDLDGKVDAGEFAAYSLHVFDKLDTDGDGILLRADFVKTVQPRMQQRGQGAQQLRGMGGGAGRGGGGRR